MPRALIAVGGNVGDREASIRAALDSLGRHGARVAAASPLVETDPVGGPPQGRYLNGAVVVETDLPPRALLAAMLAAERDAGRVRDGAVRFGPRTADLDLLLYDDLVLHEPGLDVPHPRMHERRFVLAPAAAVAPEWVHPTLGRTIAELLEDLPA